MPKKAQADGAALPGQTLVIDNGAFNMKAGFATPSPDLDKECHLIQNCLARGRDKRVWVGGQLDSCKDFGEMAFRRPVEKGYLVNWEVEKEIWDSTFFDKGARLKCDPRGTNLVLTEAANAPQALQTNCDQIVFEEFEFASYFRCVGPSLNAYNDTSVLFGDSHSGSTTSALPVESLLVIDSGFSHTTVTPLVRGRPIQQAIRRLDIGGKLMTNYLKELVSVRHYNMMDETHLMNEIKEAVCYVSNDFDCDTEKTWKGGLGDRRDMNSNRDGIVVDYVLPDYNKHTKGFMRPHDSSLAAKLRKLGAVGGAGEGVEDFMTLGNERFCVPELLFNPGDVGMKQAGFPETVMQSMSGLPPGLWPAMLANILVVGGNVAIHGFMERLQAELRQLAPAECVLRIASAPDPIKSTWLGGCRLASDGAALKKVVVTRQEYQEHGSTWLAKHFGGGSTNPKIERKVLRDLSETIPIFPD